MFPPGKDAYSQVAAQKCGELLKQTQTWVAQNVPDAEGKDTTPLYMSAAYACLGQWDDAVRTFGEIGTPPDFGDNCARTAMLSWLTALIDERRKDPTFSPVFVTSTAPSPCPSDPRRRARRRNDVILEVELDHDHRLLDHHDDE